MFEKFFEKHYESKDIIILSGSNVTLKKLNATNYDFLLPDRSNVELIFERAYEIKHLNWEYGIRNCVYLVHGREFEDLSFATGETLKEFNSCYGIGHALKIYPDGKKFIFAFEEIPTFDSGDREWDSMKYVVLYRDDEGVNLIHCQHGYEIPSIKIYIGLYKITPVISKWLNYLN